MTRLPNLKSIQAFEAVARHLSFKHAADELCVTPTAVSHQVKSLETHLGLQLLNRSNRFVSLTPDGIIYAQHISKAFEHLTAGTDALAKDEISGDLTITTTTSFASNWLSPRLAQFAELYPNLSVRILGCDDVTDFKSEPIDIAIRYGFGDYPDMHCAWVLDDYVAPVCKPALAKDLQTAEDLSAARLIQYEWSGFSEADPSWDKWLKENNVQVDGFRPFVTYSEEHMCLLTASDGHGVSLVSLIAAERYVRDGRLIVPYHSKFKNKSYFLVCPHSIAHKSKIKAFQNWLLDQADLFRETDFGKEFFC
ncbi:transcriptional regulator GcvA [Phaeobacter italicus]|jgi:LysR family glycine cleavage system transcriptional activator|uniref:transcriptional regulator GcvA n=1 Tax=Phaeobacter italicus TaxID=481446 RepID=UPI001C93BC99|nr:transcriptional regulator GcvA [Phaeobacter italicus]MBY6045996.1 transcriptional regulator GcvA [Phaeobacter italicus]MEE2811352.1 transcriptional regulator GcvA [Pseudomonadota bacterium]